MDSQLILPTQHIIFISLFDSKMDGKKPQTWRPAVLFFLAVLDMHVVNSRFSKFTAIPVL